MAKKASKKNKKTKGIVGIIAGRLREKFGRPAFAIALSPGGGTGSGRSVLGVDLAPVV